MTEEGPLSTRTDSELMALHDRHTRRSEQSLAIVKDVAEHLKLRLTGRKATRWKDDDFEVKLVEGSAKFSASKLVPLLEIIDLDELLEAGAYTLPHDDVVHVAAKWNATHLKPFLQLGDRVREVYEGARTPGPLTVEVKPVAKKAEAGDGG